MDRSEPSLVPEWLRSTGSGPGGGISNHRLASSHSDGPLLALPKRDKSSSGSNYHDLRRSSVDRSLSNNTRRNSSGNGSTRHDKNFSRSYSNFNRNHHEKEKERSMVYERWDSDYSDPLRSIMSGRIEKDTLRRSQSMVSRIQGEVFPRRTSTDSRGGNLNNSESVNGFSAGVKSGILKVPFERDFPSLGSEERPGTPELSRIPSPGLNRAAQSLPMVYSTVNNGDSWSSALADLPSRITTDSTGSSPVLQPAAPASVSMASNATAGLNMAEALVQAPIRSPSQSPVHNQRFEELAVIQSKRLIPLTPVHKTSVLNPSDKLKPRTSPRPSDPSVLLRNGNVRAEGQMTPLTGMLRVMKSGRENGVSPASKDAVVSPKANVNNQRVTSQSAGAPSVTPLLCKNHLNLKLAEERKAQAQSRTDFFNSVRKKSMNSTSVSVDVNPAVSSEEHKDVERETVSQTTCSSVIMEGNGDASDEGLLFASDEEELALLRSMGWEPHSGVDEGLTIEEIREFCEKHMEMLPTSRRCQVVQEKLALELGGICLKGTSSA